MRAPCICQWPNGAFHNVIDATIIQAGEQGYVMFIKDETRQPAQKNIRGARHGTMFEVPGQVLDGLMKLKPETTTSNVPGRRKAR